MLQPHDRTVLWSMLKPPPGFRVHRAIATTFTLDLLALLTAPLAFSLFDRLAEPQVPDGDRGARGAKAALVEPTALLAAVREHADRLTVFCQAGRIAPPARYRQLLAYLEGSVVPVGARTDGGVFHPKLWILRMVHPETEPLYRVVVATRNLTFDRSWDTALVLEGTLRPGTRGIARNRPLAEMVAELPALAVHAMDAARVDAVRAVADELRRVDFEVPEPFEELVFHPLGLGRRNPDPFGDLEADRLLVISPFLAAGRLERLGARGKNHILVSRTEELIKMPATALARFASIHVLADGAEGDQGDEGDEGDGGQGNAAPGASEPAPADLGLHAKLYVADAGRETRIWTGSANASDAAFTQNVEILVELRGKKSQVGIDRILDASTTSLRSVLSPFGMPDGPGVGESTLDRVDRAVDLLRRQLAAIEWTLGIEPHPSPSPAAAGASTQVFDLALTASAPPTADVLRATRVWPIALSPDYARPLAPGTPSARFTSVSFGALTAFVAFEVTVSEADERHTRAFVLPCRLVGAPPHRLAHILQTMLDDPQKVLRFLHMLLALDPDGALDELLGDAPDGDAGTSPRRWSPTPLLESLLRALDRDPARLEAFERTLEELARTHDGARLLPPGLDDIWPAIRDVARELRAAKVAT